ASRPCGSTRSKRPCGPSVKIKRRSGIRKNSVAGRDREMHTMNDDNGHIENAKWIRFERLLPGPIERVWEFLTDSQQLPVWFGGVGMQYVIEPRPGGEVNLADGHIRGVVTQWQPPRLLGYTWN